MIIDANVCRWLSRMTGLPYNRDPRGLRWVQELAERLTPRCAFRDFNYAVLDFTMTLCNPRGPVCPTCPVRSDCRHGQALLADEEHHTRRDDGCPPRSSTTINRTPPKTQAALLEAIVTHAEALVPGAVYVQSYPNDRRLDVAIVDVGRGVKASLSESRQVWSHGDALSQALQRGVTRSREAGMGNGLPGTHEIAARNRGRFHIWTGDALYRLERGEPRGFTPLPELPGTGVFFSLDTRRPVDLADTWMGSDDWTYLDAEAERVTSSGGLKVAGSCVDTEDREPARRLRNKIRALLPSMKEPLVVDFTGVDPASSSFLDELFGRLVAELGAEGVRRDVRIVGLQPAIRQTVDDLFGQVPNVE